jgi:hypothetical protein
MMGAGALFATELRPSPGPRGPKAPNRVTADQRGRKRWLSGHQNVLEMGHRRRRLRPDHATAEDRRLNFDARRKRKEVAESIATRGLARGKTLVVVGPGQIGDRLARLAKPFDMRASSGCAQPARRQRCGRRGARDARICLCFPRPTLLSSPVR